jgi:glycosyltransferase involved in cell wall biosynthesis
MKVSGFTLIRNGTQFDYPFIESLRSLLPLVDELIVNVGVGTDDTLQRIKKFAQEEGHGKVQYFESVWPLDDPEKKKSGLILSEQTNLALDRCTGDWAVYLQADELFHEADYSLIHNHLQTFETDTDIEGLLFDYVHFYGSFEVVQETRNAYRREVRVVKRSSGARSIGDAQSFRKPDGSKLKVIRSQARVFHYGWVRTPEAMKEKTFFFDQLYHGDPSLQDQQSRTPHTGDNYRYKRIWGLRPFKDTHPIVMKDRIQAKGWHWDLKNSPLTWKARDIKKVVLDSFERLTGIRLFEYKSYILIRKK